jgi:hypothetical protein
MAKLNTTPMPTRIIGSFLFAGWNGPTRVERHKRLAKAQILWRFRRAGNRG